MNDIVRISAASGVEVNVYHNINRKPVIEVMSKGRITLTPAQASALIRRLEEAVAYWNQEKGGQS